MFSTSKSNSNLTRAAAGLIRQFSIDPVRGAVVSLNGLTRGEKLLAIAGYAFCVSLLVLGLFLDAISGNAEPLKFPFTAAQSIHEMQPYAALFGLAGNVLAWTFIFTGAGRARKLIFYLLLVIYFAYVSLTTLFAQNLNALCLGLVIPVAFPIIHLVGRKLNLFVRAPAVMFILFGGVILAHALFAFLAVDEADTFGLILYIFFRYVNYLAFPLWMYSGLSLIGFAMAIALGIAKRSAGNSNSSILLKFVWVALAIHVLINSGIYMFTVYENPSGAGQIAPLMRTFVSVFLLIVALVLQLAKKLSPRVGVILLALSMAFGIFVIIVNSLFQLGFNATDPINAVLDKLGILPRGTFFMFTLMVGVLGAFVPFAQGDSAALPRAGRVLLAIGFAILFIAMMFVFVFTINTADGSNYTSNSVFTGLTVFGALVIGIPLTLFSLFARREASEEETPAASASSNITKIVVVVFPLITWLLNRVIVTVAR